MDTDFHREHARIYWYCAISADDAFLQNSAQRARGKEAVSIAGSWPVCLSAAPRDSIVPCIDSESLTWLPGSCGG